MPAKERVRSTLTVVKEIVEARYPTEGKLAEELWAWTSNPLTPTSVAIGVMEELGYVPFAGYPLVRRDNLPFSLKKLYNPTTNSRFCKFSGF